MRLALRPMSAGPGRPLSLGAIENAFQRVGTLKSGRCRMAATRDPFALGILPVASIEEPRRLKSRSVDVVKAFRVHGDPVWLRTRYVKRVHSAMRAERMLRHTSFERVHG